MLIIYRLKVKTNLRCTSKVIVEDGMSLTYSGNFETFKELVSLRSDV
jgi:hypothetical protein